jgi:Cu(I)/Ag(I) efflux system membrane fusion protein
MRNKKIVKTVLFVLAAGALGAAWFIPCPMRCAALKQQCLMSDMPRPAVHAAAAEKAVYFCPMHPDYTSDKPGSCPICGMTLVKKEASKPAANKKKSVKFYRNPMDPSVTSPVPMKDGMGMDYVPVYEESADASGVMISPQRQQMIGVKKEKAQKRRLAVQTRVVGTVAYDTDLYIAQDEYVQALKERDTAQSESFLNAIEKKLQLLGMNRAQIDALAANGAPDKELYLSGTGDTAWVYVTVYENDMSAVKEGAAVTVTTDAYPGVEFKGTVSSLTPVLDAATRAVQGRCSIADPEHRLKPQMFVNAVISSDLGERLAIPESAVLDTGTRTLVYVVSADDTFEQREVTVGVKAGGYYEVVKGLSEGEMVVSSGNFLIDAESRLNGAK